MECAEFHEGFGNAQQQRITKAVSKENSTERSSIRLISRWITYLVSQQIDSVGSNVPGPIYMLLTATIIR